MKKLLALTLSLLLLLSLTACGAGEDVEYYVTKTQTVRQTGDITVQEYTYDDQWNLLSSNILLNGKFSSASEYTYSNDFTIVTNTTTSAIYEPSTTIVIRTFDDKEQVIQAKTYDGDRLVSTTEYTYDDDGNTVLAVQISPEDEIISKVERIFDESGNLVTYLQNSGLYTSRQEYTYDKKNHRIREEFYQNDAMTSYSEYTWEGNTAYGNFYNAEGTLMSKSIAHHDDAGNRLANEILDVSGNFQAGNYFEYIGTDGSISSGIPELTDSK